jgi:hypothetical protein
MKHSAESAAKAAPSAIMSCLPMFARSYNQMRDEHVVEMPPARAPLGGGAASHDGASVLCSMRHPRNHDIPPSAGNSGSFMNASSAVMCSTGFTLDAGFGVTASIKLGDCPQCPQPPPLSHLVQPGKIAITLFFETSAPHTADASDSRYVATVIPVDLTQREDAADLVASSSVRTVYCVTSSIALTQQDM